MAQRVTRGVFALLCLLPLHTACVARQAIVTSSQMDGARVGTGMWTREELYFGMSTPTGMVSDTSWQLFLDREVAPRLPDGFTIFESVGYYRDQRTGRTEREPSRVLLVYYRENQSQTTRALTELAAIYKRMFNQQSVLRITSLVRATF
ncbi:MAG: DUF3574 domain-containing protein [Longimicrobiales bacterium]